MKLLALLVGCYSTLGLGGVVVAATMQDPRSRPLSFGLGTLIMSIAGFRAARSIWRGRANAERRFYVWAVTVTVMLASLGVAFPYAFAQRAGFSAPATIGVAIFCLLVAISGRFIRHRAHAV
jgi:hypothetical protein